MTTLVNRVGQKMSLSVGESTNPSKSQVVDWLNEGLDTLMRILPYDYFPNSMMVASIASSAGTKAVQEISMDIPTASDPIANGRDLVSLLSVAVINSAGADAVQRPCKIINQARYEAIKSNMDVYRVVSNDMPLASIYGGKIYATTSASAANAGKQMKVDYVGAKSIAASSTTCSENPIIDRLVVDFAVMNAKYADDEIQDWLAKSQEWYRSSIDFSYGETPSRREDVR